MTGLNLLSWHDIYRTANLLIKQRGALEAEIEAAQRADELLAAGDMDGRGVWLRVVEGVINRRTGAGGDGALMPQPPFGRCR